METSTHESVPIVVGGLIVIWHFLMVSRVDRGEDSAAIWLLHTDDHSQQGEYLCHSSRGSFCYMMTIGLMSKVLMSSADRQLYAR